jgi:uncharacterized membrane protein (DUF485 family)
MTETSHKKGRWWQLGGLMWLALGLFIVFFLNVLLQRFRPGVLDVSAVQEAVLLVIAIGVFVSACLSLESREAQSE